LGSLVEICMDPDREKDAADYGAAGRRPHPGSVIG
jgi:hypothetical protein